MASACGDSGEFRFAVRRRFSFLSSNALIYPQQNSVRSSDTISGRQSHNHSQTRYSFVGNCFFAAENYDTLTVNEPLGIVGRYDTFGVQDLPACD